MYFFVHTVSLAYFQLRMGPVRSCFDFMVANIKSICSLVNQIYGLNYHIGF